MVNSKMQEVDALVFASSNLKRKRTSLPAALNVSGNTLGKGSNNTVVKGTWEDKPCALRMPRRASDTTMFSNAMWEACHTLKASQLGVAPAVHAMWFARHRTGEFPAGLYIVSDLYENDLDRTMTKKRDYTIKHSDAIADNIIVCLEKLAKERMFVYDLKPNNIMVNTSGDSPVIKIIDFGRDFCEWEGGEDKADANTPAIRMLRRLIRERNLDREEERVEHVLFATMLVQLAATTTFTLYQDRRKMHTTADDRRRLNGIARKATTFLEGMAGCNVSLLREMLRWNGVKGVLIHYHGRRNAGTHRTLDLARGVE